MARNQVVGSGHCSRRREGDPFTGAVLHLSETDIDVCVGLARDAGMGEMGGVATRTEALPLAPVNPSITLSLIPGENDRLMVFAAWTRQHASLWQNLWQAVKSA